MTDRRPTEPSRGHPRVVVHASAASAARDAAERIAATIAAARADGRRAVLGLATGRSPEAVYDELARMHDAGALSFEDVETFNLDEYFPIEPRAPGAFHRYMHEHFFDRVDLPPRQRHVPYGWIAEDEVANHCRDYEAQIAAAGGIDLQLVGVGRDGHVGFNEPGSTEDSRTRLVTLHPWTVEDNRAAFPDGAVPARAITMGIGTILAARRILVLAFGAHKAAIVRAVLEGPITPDVPASFLRDHDDVTFLLDREAVAMSSVARAAASRSA